MPNQLGPEYNAKIFAGWAEVWRLLGWKPNTDGPVEGYAI